MEHSPAFDIEIWAKFFGTRITARFRHKVVRVVLATWFWASKVDIGLTFNKFDVQVKCSIIWFAFFTLMKKMLHSAIFIIIVFFIYCDYYVFFLYTSVTVSSLFNSTIRKTSILLTKLLATKRNLLQCPRNYWINSVYICPLSDRWNTNWLKKFKRLVSFIF